MQDNSRTTTTTVPACLPLPSNEYGVEFNYISTDSNNDHIDSNRPSFHTKCDTAISRIEKFMKKNSHFHVEKRGIERISPEDRTDLTILNTAMIWVRNLFDFSNAK